MAHFIKLVGDLNAICNDGTNEHFFDGVYYLQISDRMAEPARGWCQENLATVKLKSEGATDDEPPEPYVIRLGEKEGKKDLKSLMHKLGATFVTIMFDAANAIHAKNVMTSQANEAFDAAEEGARLRASLLNVAAKRRPGLASALLLNV